MAALLNDYDEKDEKKGDDTATMALMADADMDALRADIEKQPLVSDIQSLDHLTAEFKDHANFTRQMKSLISEGKHSSYRQMRRDGNCFYRAFLLGLFETIESSRDLTLLTTVSENVMTSLHRCLKYGFDSFTVEDFYYAFMDELEFYQRKLESGDPDFKATDGVGHCATERMSSSGHAQYLIFWARMLASIFMRENEKDYKHFIDKSKGGFATWLRSDVEALNSEADHLQTVALSKALGVPITIYCLENVSKGGPQKVYTIETKNNASCLDLLFRPGHYDVLYRKVAQKGVPQTIASAGVTSDTEQKEGDTQEKQTSSAVKKDEADANDNNGNT